MAIKVPQYERQRESLRGLPTSGRGLRISGQDITGGLGQGVSDVAGAAAKVREKSLIETNQARVLEAANQLDGYQNETITGEALQRKGKNALGLTQEYLPKFDEKAAEIRNGLNDAQKQAFDEIVMRRKSSVHKSLLTHEKRQFDTYRQGETKAYQENRYQDALANYNDPQAINENLASLQSSIRMQAKTEGWSDEQRTAALEASGSNVVYGVIERQTANGDADMAAAFLDQNRDYLEGEQLVKAEKLVRTASLRKRAQNETDRLMAMDMPLQDALSEARGIEESELRDETVRRIKARYSERDAAEKRQKEQALEQAENIIEDPNSTVDDVPPAIWGELSASQRSALETRSRQVQSGVEPTTDYTTWTNVMAMPTRKLATADPIQMRPKLDDAHYERFLNMRRQARADLGMGGLGDKAPDTTSTLTFKDRVTQSAGLAGIVPVDESPSKWGDIEKQRFFRFQQEAARRIEEAEIEKGRKLTGTEQQSVIDQMTAEKVMETSGWDEEMVAATLSTDELGTSYVPMDSIPASERQDLERYIRDLGAEPTDDLIQRAFVGILLEDPQLVNDIIAQELE